MSSETKRIAALETEILALRDQLREALSRLDATHDKSPRTSLRVHLRCPICDGRSILRCYKVADRDAPLAITRTLFDAQGRFVVYVCRECGHAEWYVSHPEAIPTERDGFELLEGPPRPPTTGPFR
jgi:predicted RNA-binding Zn-ribbon protein involved in translation (DUF1610 family)